MCCRLNVCSNSIGDEGLCALATVINTANVFLTKVTIWGNKIGEPTCLVRPGSSSPAQ